MSDSKETENTNSNDQKRQSKIEQRRARQKGSSAKADPRIRRVAIIAGSVVGVVLIPLFIFGPEAVFKAIGLSGEEEVISTKVSEVDKVVAKVTESNPGEGLLIPAFEKKEPPKIVQKDSDAEERIKRLEKTISELSSKKVSSREELENMIAEREKLLKEAAKSEMAAELQRQRLEFEQRLAEKQATDAATAEEEQKLAEIENGKVNSSGLVLDFSEEGSDGEVEVAANDETSLRLEGLRKESQNGNLSFMEAAVEASVETVQAEQIKNLSKTIVQGTIIPAVLETALDTQLPGFLRAQVTRDVYSHDGLRVLLPSGSRLIGTFNTDLAVAQKRVFIAWTRAVTPAGKSIALGSVGTDRLGRSGVEGNVDNRYLARFGSAFMISAISVLPQILGAGQPNQGNAPAVQFGDTTQNHESNAGISAIGNVGNEINAELGKRLSLPPVIRLPQGHDITIFVNRDLVF